MERSGSFIHHKHAAVPAPSCRCLTLMDGEDARECPNTLTRLVLVTSPGVGQREKNTLILVLIIS